MIPSIDKIHPLKHPDAFGPCLFVELRPDNWREWLDIAIQGGFKWIMFDPFWGDWYTPRRFGLYEEVKGFCVEARKAGIRIAAHCYLNTIDANAKLIDWKDPPWDWGDVLEGDYCGIVEDVNGKLNKMAGHGAFEIANAGSYHLAYGIIAADKSMGARIEYEGDLSFKAVFGAEGTSPIMPAKGTKIYRLRNRSGFFPKHGSPLQELLIQRFAQTVTDCGIDWVYCDGYSSPVQGANDADTSRLHWENGIAPYVEHVPAIVSLGGTVPECAYDRVFSVMRGDAVTLFNNKYDGDFPRYFYDQLRWNHLNLPLRQASGWWPIWNDMTAAPIERYWAVRGQVVLQDMPGEKSFLNHPQRDGIVKRMRTLNGGR